MTFNEVIAAADNAGLTEVQTLTGWHRFADWLPPWGRKPIMWEFRPYRPAIACWSDSSQVVCLYALRGLNERMRHGATGRTTTLSFGSTPFIEVTTHLLVPPGETAGKSSSASDTRVNRLRRQK